LLFLTKASCNEYCEKGAKPFDLINGLQEKFGTLPPAGDGMNIMKMGPEKIPRG